MAKIACFDNHQDDRLMIVDDFPHQCRDAGIKHLFEIIENVITH